VSGIFGRWISIISCRSASRAGATGSAMNYFLASSCAAAGRSMKESPELAVPARVPPGALNELGSGSCVDGANRGQTDSLSE
jgi:hypothetical protein